MRSFATEGEVLAYLTDCILATVWQMAIRKTRPKAEYTCQIGIAQKALDAMLRFGTDFNLTRATDVVRDFSGNVEAWARSFEPVFNTQLVSCKLGSGALPSPRRNVSVEIQVGKRKVQGRPAYTLEQLQAIASQHDGICLSKKYLGGNTLWRCCEGHEWRERVISIEKHGWCPKCILNAKREQHQVKTRAPQGFSVVLSNMHFMASKHGGECISTAFEASGDKLIFKCWLGHRFKALPLEVIQGKWCPFCGPGHVGPSPKKPLKIKPITNKLVLETIRVFYPTGVARTDLVNHFAAITTLNRAKDRPKEKISIEIYKRLDILSRKNLITQFEGIIHPSSATAPSMATNRLPDLNPVLKKKLFIALMSEDRNEEGPNSERLRIARCDFLTDAVHAGWTLHQAASAIGTSVKKSSEIMASVVM